MHRLPLMILGALVVLAVPTFAAEFTSDWHLQHDRIWIGPQYWANPMEDWRLRDGRLECTSSGPDRNVHLLAPSGEGDGTFEMSVVVGLQQSPDRQEGTSPSAQSASKSASKANSVTCAVV
ncbi:MAG: hypothetical protein R3B91_01380 [Planctomycetaceae bacterium]